MAEPRRVAAVAYDMLASKLGSEGIVTAADKAVLELLEDEEGAAACATELEDGKVDAEAADPLAALGVAGAWRRRLFACCELTAAANLGCRGDGIIWESESGADDDSRRHTWPRVICRSWEDGMRTRYTNDFRRRERLRTSGRVR